MESASFSAADALVVERAIYTRRSIQNFIPGRVDPALVRRAVELACRAPNHKLTEPWRFYMLGEETAAKIVSRNTEMVRIEKGEAAAANKQARWSEIPHWLVVTCRRSEDAFREKEDYAACCCAAMSIMLFLWANGVGMKWTTGPVIRDAAFFGIVGVRPDSEFVVGLYQYGFAAEIPQAHRSPAEDFLTELS